MALSRWGKQMAVRTKMKYQSLSYGVIGENTFSFFERTTLDLRIKTGQYSGHNPVQDVALTQIA